MNMIKNWTRRFSMTVLFFLALLTTFQSISGVEAKSLISFAYGQAEHEQASFTHKLKSLGLAFKGFKRVTQTHTLISSSEAVARKPKSLEDLDWSKYPKKTVVATGYTAGVESTGKDSSHPEYGITYSGIKVKRDLYSTIAADLKVFPLGTVLFIPEYGYGVVADKGGAIKGNKLDLYFETVKDVYNQWGKKTVEVYVVKMGAGSVTEKELLALNEDEGMQVFRQQYISSVSR